MDNSFKFRCGRLPVSLSFYATLTSLLLSSGCASNPAIRALPDQWQQAVTDRPLYQQSTNRYPAGQLQSQFKKISDYVKAGKSALAKNTADQIDPNSLSPEELNQFNLLYSQILLSFGEAAPALERLTGIQPEQLNTEQKISYFQSLAFGHSLTGNNIESAKARIILNQLLTEPNSYNRNQLAILDALKALPDSTLQDLYQAQADVELGGWAVLATILKRKGMDNSDIPGQIAQWREAYPGHSANTVIQNLQNPSRSVADSASHVHTQPGAIALFLPETGPYAEAGKAIRAGFMAAYNSPVNNTVKPSYRVYNSEQGSLNALYGKAIAEGAELIVGPLSKESIQNLADTTTLSVPVLALNHIPSLQKANLYQFGLSPLDDVASVSSKAWQDGHKKSLLLTPDNEPGHRVASYFEQEWHRFGGTILDSQTYSPKKTEFTDTIKKLLNVNESESRYQKISAMIPGMVFIPRRREDIGALLLSAHSDQARLINAQLQLYHASTLPVYALPNVYSGLPDPAKDGALNNITFCDTPWVFSTAYPGNLSLNALAKVWGAFPNSYLRLVAMGIDTYHLATRLNSRDINAFPGATGSLSLSSDNRIKRDLTCAKFTNGQVVVLNPGNGL